LRYSQRYCRLPASMRATAASQRATRPSSPSRTGSDSDMTFILGRESVHRTVGAVRKRWLRHVGARGRRERRVRWRGVSVAHHDGPTSSGEYEMPSLSLRLLRSRGTWVVTTIAALAILVFGHGGEGQFSPDSFEHRGVTYFYVPHTDL